VILSTFLLDTTGKINQGNFRVNDLVVFSTATVQDIAEKESTTENTTGEVASDAMNSLSDLRLDVTQNNEISFLIAKSEGVDITEMYIDNVIMKFPTLTENMYIYQDETKKIDLKEENIKLALNKEDKDGQYLIKLNIENKNCIKEAVIPESEASIVFDGTIFKILNTKISDISFNIQFNLNIYDSMGKLNICKVKLNLPNELLVTNGLSVTKEEVGNFPFRIK
jgi:hypothetical protein